MNENVSTKLQAGRDINGMAIIGRRYWRLQIGLKNFIDRFTEDDGMK